MMDTTLYVGKSVNGVTRRPGSSIIRKTLELFAQLGVSVKTVEPFLV